MMGRGRTQSHNNEHTRGSSLMYVVLLMTLLAVLSSGYMAISRYNMKAALKNRRYMEAQLSAKTIHRSFCEAVSSGESPAMNLIWQNFQEDCDRVREEFDAMMDVEVLASAFNMDKAEFMGRRILIDNFGELTGAKLLLCDESFFQIYDVLLQFEDVRNPEGLYWNYFLHKWTVFSVSRFANAILFTVPDNEITGITLNPSNSVIQRSQLPKDVTINATIKSTGTVDDTLEWEMTGNESTETTMTVVNNTQVRVHVSANEKIPNTFNIIAKSKYFPVSQTATISTRENV